MLLVEMSVIDEYVEIKAVIIHFYIDLRTNRNILQCRFFTMSVAPLNFLNGDGETAWALGMRRAPSCQCRPSTFFSTV